jgi:hypothetical protein
LRGLPDHQERPEGFGVDAADVVATLQGYGMPESDSKVFLNVIQSFDRFGRSFECHLAIFGLQGALTG